MLLASTWTTDVWLACCLPGVVDSISVNSPVSTLLSTALHSVSYIHRTWSVFVKLFCAPHAVFDQVFLPGTHESGFGVVRTLVRDANDTTPLPSFLDSDGMFNNLDGVSANPFKKQVGQHLPSCLEGVCM